MEQKLIEKIFNKGRHYLMLQKGIFFKLYKYIKKILILNGADPLIPN